MQRRIALCGILVSTLAILAATLRPAGAELAPGWSFDLVSGGAGVAELIQNLLLFLPLGASLALAGVRPWRAIATGAALSFSVEFLQQWIPGRDPSVGDILTNTISTALGVALVRSAPRWLGTTPRRSAWYAVGSAAAAVTIWGGTGALLRPIFAEPPYYDAWTPNYNDWGHYEGSVTSATLGPLVLAPDTISRDDPGLPRALIMAGQPLRITAVAPSHPPHHKAPLVAIGDTIDQDMLMLAVDGADLTLHYSTLALRAQLEQPDLRWRGALARVAPFDTFTTQMWREQRTVCLGVNAAHRCGFGYTIGDGWKLIYYPDRWAGWHLAVLNFLWVAGLMSVAGFWSAKSGQVGVVIATVAVTAGGLSLVPALTVLNVTPVSEWFGALAGLASGYCVGWYYGVLQPSRMGAAVADGVDA